jgi:ubiquinone/menaquinone biosynthesis C-methylase UbiE
MNMENSDQNKTAENIRNYWNERATLGQLAGSKDYLAKQLEIEAIAKYVKDGQKVLDFGCGNGITAIELARRYSIDIIGIDYAGEMVKAASGLAKNESLKGNVSFITGEIQDLEHFKERFDLIYTERVLINLSDFSSQKHAIITLTHLLKPDSLYVMCENSQDGLNSINMLRKQIGLSEIKPPWHNRYFNDDEIMELRIPGIVLYKVEDYSSTYYFLSRIVNAWLAKNEGREPDYNAPINQLSLLLPSIGSFGQGRIWVWKKISGGE